MEFKDRIKSLRAERGMTLTELGSVFKKSESACRAWELGRTKPDADTLAKLAEYFDCTTDYMLGLSEYKNRVEMLDSDIILKEIKMFQDSLTVNTRRNYQNIQRYISGCYNCLLYDDELLADEAMEHIHFLLRVLYDHCESAFAVFGAGYDSFDFEDIPSIANEIETSAKSDTEMLRNSLYSFLNKLSKRMIDSLPEFTRTPLSYLDELKQMQKEKLDGYTRTKMEPEEAAPHAQKEE